MVLSSRVIADRKLFNGIYEEMKSLNIEWSVCSLPPCSGYFRIGAGEVENRRGGGERWTEAD